MENASKAIIIGGSVLVAILIVSLGIVIYNNSKDTVGTAATSVASLEVQLYNQKFEKYIDGGSITGRNLKALISEAIASKSDIQLNACHRINSSLQNQYGGSTGRSLELIIGYIETNKTYWICVAERDRNTNKIKSLAIENN